jgi:hypothetical protein
MITNKTERVSAKEEINGDSLRLQKFLAHGSKIDNSVPA